MESMPCENRCTCEKIMNAKELMEFSLVDEVVLKRGLISPDKVGNRAYLTTVRFMFSCHFLNTRKKMPQNRCCVTIKRLE